MTRHRGHTPHRESRRDGCGRPKVRVSRKGGRSVRRANSRQRGGRVREFAGIDLLATLGPGDTTDRDALARQAKAARITIAADDGWSDISAASLSSGSSRGSAWGTHRARPLSRAEAALARAAISDGRLAERFELYLCGVELANGFGELTDATEQRARFEREMDEKQRIYGERYPIDEGFSPRSERCRRQAGSRSGSTVLSCLQHARGGSTASCGHRLRTETMNERVLRSRTTSRGPN